jgi:tetrahydromethanopterin S-methyltransferase subunit B
MSAELKVPLLPAIRTDTAVVKAARSKMFLADFDPKSKALEDYEKAADILLKSLQPDTVHDVSTQATA